ncbi:D-amino acid aminotransferase [Variovorax dokdonensis]|uniref:D-amino acid aminotransferase n=1 Tax=Variovorax dokdonensis TaxID=344883 RepID=A0ABT7NHF2_9BURK|nr:D-amino acid aminotransferase [Variovorax dokdonensis]MDM0047371.1 D-amino acid aminotransferase [Variovorax dokdonensis]
MSALPATLCYLDGQYLPLNQAKVSVLDRGFLFGDGVYDVVPVYDRKLFRFDEHLARFARSMDKVRISNPHTREQWLERCRTLIEAHPDDDQTVYLQVTRGVAPRDHVMPLDVDPTVFMMASTMRRPGTRAVREGVACVSADDFRWERGDIKSTSLLGNVLARQISADVGATETILFRDGLLTEAAASNVWVVQSGAVFGVPRSQHVLEGIRYELIRELCEQEGIAFSLQPISAAQVHGADELLLSSASKEVLAVVHLDGRPIGEGKPGPVFQRLYSAYQGAKAAQSI